MIIPSGYGSHLPVLIKLVTLTEGPILELGTGLFSTPYLHWACFLPKRKLISYDNDSNYFAQAKEYVCDYHEVHFVEDWDKIDISGHWTIALIDHTPRGRRIEEIKRLANSCDYIVVHDTNGRWDPKYRYSLIYPLFKYRYDFRGSKPFTTVLSNSKDLSNLL